tara:strand:+ start:10901 stop:12226 length:1326 start_codon:yes stop_codon:yes gene_type:complete
MAYQNIGTPRFYIDYLSYFSSIGAIKKIWQRPQYDGLLEGDFIGFDAVSSTKVGSLGTTSIAEMDVAIEFYDNIPLEFLETLNFGGFIGHNFNENSIEGYKFGVRPFAYWKHPDLTDDDFPAGGNDNVWSGDFSINNLSGDIADGVIINTNYHEIPDVTNIDGQIISDTMTFPNSGFSLFKGEWQTAGMQADITDAEGNLYTSDDFKNPSCIGLGMKCWGVSEDGSEFYQPFQGIWHMNSFVLGKYYDMPQSPELEMTMEIEYDGVKNITTRGGAHLSNVYYKGSPMWKGHRHIFDENNNIVPSEYESPPWIVGNSNGISRRYGRRVWDLSFNYLSEKDLFSSNYMSNDYLETSGTNTDYDNNDDLTSDNNNFYYKFFEDDSFHARVLNFIGGGKRFVFQPDNTNNNPDQFAICILDDSSLDVEQIANGVYNISMTIREVW